MSHLMVVQHQSELESFYSRSTSQSALEGPEGWRGNGRDNIEALSDTNVNSSITTNMDWTNKEGEKVRQQLLEVLASRRQQQVPREVHTAKREGKPYFQQEVALLNPLIFALCPRGEAPTVADELEEENLMLTTEAGEQGQVPLLIIRPKLSQPTAKLNRRPTVVCLHSTGSSKEVMRPTMQSYASQGYVAVAIDSRYHGDRGHTPHAYANALIAAWKTGQEMPFIFDTVWDLIKVMDYLTERPDVDPAHIGMMGISLGGMIAWFAAAADPRIAVVVPLIGVQSFGWALSNKQWHARVNSIPHPFQVAAEDLGKDEVDAETVAAVWQRLAPGLTDKLDSPYTIPAIAPRPLLILNGKDDPRCPVEGLELLITKTAQVYKDAGVPDHFKFVAEEGCDHTIGASMGQEASSWFDTFLKPGAGG